MNAGAVSRIRRHWLATSNAPEGLRTAAENSASLTCVSAARHRGWWIPEGVPDGIHLRFEPHGTKPASQNLTTHWTRRIAPPPGYGLIESVEDTLAHVALCLPPESAQVVWNSAAGIEGLSPRALQRVRWRTAAARRCAGRVSAQSDSGLETIALVRLAPLGVPIAQQVVLLGRPVDLLVGERLVVQIDGFEHHSSSAQRTKDVRFDAELVLAGFTVLRFTYAQVVHDWDHVERTVARAIAAGAHLTR